MRFFSTPSVRKQGFERVTDLIEINPRLLFQRHIKLVEFDPEALKQLAIRKATWLFIAVKKRVILSISTALQFRDGWDQS